MKVVLVLGLFTLGCELSDAIGLGLSLGGGLNVGLGTSHSSAGGGLLGLGIGDSSSTAGGYGANGQNYGESNTAGTVLGHNSAGGIGLGLGLGLGGGVGHRKAGQVSHEVGTVNVLGLDLLHIGGGLGGTAAASSSADVSANTGSSGGQGNTYLSVGGAANTNLGEGSNTYGTGSVHKSLYVGASTAGGHHNSAGAHSAAGHKSAYDGSGSGYVTSASSSGTSGTSAGLTIRAGGHGHSTSSSAGAGLAVDDRSSTIFSAGHKGSSYPGSKTFGSGSGLIYLDNSSSGSSGSFSAGTSHASSHASSSSWSKENSFSNSRKSGYNTGRLEYSSHAGDSVAGLASSSHANSNFKVSKHIAGHSSDGGLSAGSEIGVNIGVGSKVASSRDKFSSADSPTESNSNVAGADLNVNTATATSSGSTAGIGVGLYKSVGLTARKSTDVGVGAALDLTEPSAGGFLHEALDPNSANSGLLVGIDTGIGLGVDGNRAASAVDTASGKSVGLEAEVSAGNTKNYSSASSGIVGISASRPLVHKGSYGGSSAHAGAGVSGGLGLGLGR